LTGIGLFNGDPLLCDTPACGESLGYLSDKHLTPLLKQAFPPAIAVAIAAFAAAAPNHLEMMSYYAVFRVPKLVTRHPAEVFGVLYKLRERLAAWNPGPKCYDFHFFDRHPTPEMVQKNLPPDRAQELISACTKRS